MNVLFICNGNVCRSPLAEALLKKKFRENHVKGKVSSAGFESFNINESPDLLTRKFAMMKGLDLTGKAKLFRQSDFDNYDLIFVMDTKNYHDVADLARNDEDLKKVSYLMNLLEPYRDIPIPDPFTSGIKDMQTIFDLLDRATDEILRIATVINTDR